MAQYPCSFPPTLLRGNGYYGCKWEKEVKKRFWKMVHLVNCLAGIQRSALCSTFQFPYFSNICLPPSFLSLFEWFLRQKQSCSVRFSEITQAYIFLHTFLEHSFSSVYFFIYIHTFLHSLHICPGFHQYMLKNKMLTFCFWL